MSRKRRTRQDKIIAKLKRQLSVNQTVSKSKVKTVPLKNQEKTHPKIKSQTSQKIYHHKPQLIKKDLIKTSLYSLLFTSIILLLFWYLEKGGEEFISNLLIN